MSENHAKTARRSAAPRRGSALIIVILVALVLTVIGLGIAFFATTEDKTSGNVRMSKVGFYAAEAGLREAEAAITTYASSRPAGDCTPLLTGTPYNPPGGGRPAYPLVIDGRRFANIVLPVELGDPSTRAMYSVFVRNNEEDLTGGNNADSDKRINIVVVGQMGGDLVDWAKKYMLRPGFELASPEDMHIPRCVISAEEVLGIVRDHQARWLAAQSTAARG